MLRHLLLLSLALLITACGSHLGQPHDALLGQWKATDTYGGDTWTFRKDGTFTAEGGAPKGTIANPPRTGRWGVKDEVIALDFTTLSARENPTYGWKIEDNRLLLSTPGNTAPSIILFRPK